MPSPLGFAAPTLQSLSNSLERAGASPAATGLVNATAINDAIAQGGTITCTTPGTYRVQVSALNSAVTQAIMTSPGVQFTNSLTGAPLSLGIAYGSTYMGANLGSLLGRKICAYALGTSGSNFTFHYTIELDADFDLFRIVHSGGWDATGWTLTHAIYAPSASYNDGFNPLDAAGGAQGWADVTYNNSGADGLPPSPGGSQIQCDFPPAVVVSGVSATTVMSLGFSDWMQCSSLPRIDGGKRPMLMVRTYSAAGQKGPSYVGAGVSTLAQMNAQYAVAGYRWEEYHKAGDNVTTPGNFTSPTGPSTFFQGILGIQYYSRVRGLSVLHIGDSFCQGYRTNSGFTSYGWYGCAAVSTPKNPVAYLNGAHQGSIYRISTANAKPLIDCFKPNVCIIQGTSVNDGTSTQALVQNSFANALDLMRYSLERGAIPIMVTPAPCNVYNATSDGWRQQVRQQILAMQGQGISVLDWEFISDGASPARIQAQYNSGDALHMNDLAHQQLGSSVSMLMGTIVQSIRG